MAFNLGPKVISSVVLSQKKKFKLSGDITGSSTQANFHIKKFLSVAEVCMQTPVYFPMTVRPSSPLYTPGV